MIVRGRVDHKDRGETKLVVQEVEPFEPTRRGDRRRRRAAARARREEAAAPVARRRVDPVVLKVDAGPATSTLIGDLKSVLEHFPGDAEVLLEMETSAGPRRLRFGAGYRVSPSVALRAELDQLLGPDALVA